MCPILARVSPLPSRQSPKIHRAIATALVAPRYATACAVKRAASTMRGTSEITQE